MLDPVAELNRVDLLKNHEAMAPPPLEEMEEVNFCVFFGMQTRTLENTKKTWKKRSQGNSR